MKLTNEQSIIKPLRPKKIGRKVGQWNQWPTPEPLARAGYPCERWYLPEFMLQVISAIEVAYEGDGTSKGPEYHISISKLQDGILPSRVDSMQAKWVLEQFGLEGAEEDNHVAGGVVRNFWRAVAEPLIGKECACKEDEPAIKEDKGDFVWRP